MNENEHYQDTRCCNDKIAWENQRINRCDDKMMIFINDLLDEYSKKT